jgi:dipeptidyl aminopeptidase/acylaminoacyl peptidase
MKRLFPLTLSFLALAACTTSPSLQLEDATTGVEDPNAASDPGAGKRAFEIADFYRCAVVSGPSLAPDGARVAFSVRRYVLEEGKSSSQIWMMGSDGTGQRAMTSGEHNDTDPRFSPDGQQLLFVSDRSGSSQLWIMPVDGGEPKQLTRFGPGVGSPEWSPDGRYVAVTSDLQLECGIDEDCNQKIADGREKGKLTVHVADDLLYRHWTGWRDGTRTHVLLVDAKSGKIEKDLTPGPWDSPTFSLGGRGFAFSPDGLELCFVSNRDKDEASSTNADLWVVPVDGTITEKSAVNLTASNRGWDGEPLYSPDGKWIAYVSQETPGYESDLRRLAVYDRAKKTTRILTDRHGFDDWVDDMRWTKNSGALVFQAQHHGRNPLYRIELDGSQAAKPAKLYEHAFIAGWELSPDGQELVYTRRSIHEPAEVFRTSFPATMPERLTTFNQAVEEEVDIRRAEELWLPGDGGTEIHCFLVKPHGFDPKAKYPLILNVHGGPQSQWADAFRGDWQVYPGKGYVVAFCNPTGSTGYGQEFTDGITADWGGRVYRDLMKVTDALEKLPYVDSDRVGVMGWSYGGYMTMWMQGHTDRYRCIASMMGVYDLEAMYGSTEELWFPEHDLKGTPWTSEEYAKWAPVKFVKNFKTPALVVTGEKDYRVPYTQSPRVLHGPAEDGRAGAARRVPEGRALAVVVRDGVLLRRPSRLLPPLARRGARAVERRGLREQPRVREEEGRGRPGELSRRVRALSGPSPRFRRAAGAAAPARDPLDAGPSESGRGRARSCVPPRPRRSRNRARGCASRRRGRAGSRRCPRARSRARAGGRGPTTSRRRPRCAPRTACRCSRTPTRCTDGSGRRPTPQ